MGNNNFERKLPIGYREAKRIDAQSSRTAVILNLVGLVIMALVLVFTCLPIFLDGKASVENGGFWIWLAVFASLVAYIVLHELVHGAAYKLTTGEKLTFGISLTCAFCGVPKIYTYRKTALFAVLAPFVLFSVLLVGALVIAYFVNIGLYFVLAFVLANHVGGCVGDLYVGGLLLFKYKDNSVLMNDTGPKMTFFVKDAEEKS